MPPCCGGDFAPGYVLVYEVGRHARNQTGVAEQVCQARNRTSQAGANRLSVKMELQADCCAGVWGRYMRNRGILEQGGRPCAQPPPCGFDTGDIAQCDTFEQVR